MTRFEDAERARVERLRQQRANSRQLAKARQANPLDYERDNVMAGVAYRFASKTKDGANLHRATRGQGTETLDETERRAAKIASRWKNTGITDEQLNRIDALGKDEITALASSHAQRADDWDLVESDRDVPDTILYYND